MFLNNNTGFRSVLFLAVLVLLCCGCGRSALRVSRMAQPEYPLDAREHNIQGDVVVGVQIGIDGTVLWTHTSGNSVLAVAAGDNARKWTWGAFPPRFEFPAYHEVLYRYRLEGHDACVDGQPPTVKTDLPEIVEIIAPPCHPS